MSLIKSAEEIKTLQEGGKILSRILNYLASEVRPGLSTFYLDGLARAEIKKYGAQASFLGYRLSPNLPPFPAALCTSINNEVVHGIPKKDRILLEGDIVSLDLGIIYYGLYTDAAVTVPVGRVEKKAQKLINTAKLALKKGISQMKPGARIGDLASAIQRVGEDAGFGVIRDLGGHGVGHAVHEPPFVPNFGKPGTLEKFEAGMVLAVEPMFTAGDYHINFLDDGWTVVTADSSLSAHFEHTIAITHTGNIVLTE